MQFPREVLDIIYDHFMGETVRKVKHSSVRIENPLSALYRGTEYFGLARTFRTAWGGGSDSHFTGCETICVCISVSCDGIHASAQPSIVLVSEEKLMPSLIICFPLARNGLS